MPDDTLTPQIAMLRNQALILVVLRRILLQTTGSMSLGIVTSNAALADDLDAAQDQTRVWIARLEKVAGPVS